MALLPAHQSIVCVDFISNYKSYSCAKYLSACTCVYVCDRKTDGFKRNSICRKEGLHELCLISSIRILNILLLFL